MPLQSPVIGTLLICAALSTAACAAARDGSQPGSIPPETKRAANLYRFYSGTGDSGVQGAVQANEPKTWAELKAAAAAAVVPDGPPSSEDAGLARKLQQAIADYEARVERYDGFIAREAARYAEARAIEKVMLGNTATQQGDISISIERSLGVQFNAAYLQPSQASRAQIRGCIRQAILNEGHWVSDRPAGLHPSRYLVTLQMRNANAVKISEIPLRRTYTYVGEADNGALIPRGGAVLAFKVQDEHGNEYKVECEPNALSLRIRPGAVGSITIRVEPPVAAAETLRIVGLLEEAIVVPIARCEGLAEAEDL